MSVYLGIDPGFANIGIAIAELDRGVLKPIYMDLIETKKNDELSVSEDNFNRAKDIYYRIKDLFKPDIPNKYKGIDGIYVEAMSYPRNASTAAKMSLCWGALAGIVIEHRKPLVQLNPRKIKALVTGNNKASKKDMEISIRARFPETDFGILLQDVIASLHEHPFDALGTIIAGLMLEKKL